MSQCIITSRFTFCIEAESIPLIGPQTWHEMARPQIHGYDMQCVAMTTSLLYISGADEKVQYVLCRYRVMVEGLG